MAFITFQPNDYFNTKLTSGNSSTQAVTGVGFSPSLVWGKNRSGTQGHQLLDVLRGANNVLVSNNNDGAVADSQILNSFDSDGFTLGSQDQLNDTGQTYVFWNWKAGTTSGISAGSQTITPSAYSINTTAGFGIYKWSRTGASTTDFFSHGLGATPTIAIQKRTDLAQDWYVNTTVIDGTNDNLHLNKTDAKEDDSTTVPTSTNYYPKSPETGDYITYLFTPVRGFSKFGSYTGNQNADGSFIYTGFKPAWLLIKNISDGDDGWLLIDNKRSAYNQTYNYSTAHASSAEGGTGFPIDLVSNGFKIRGADISYNQSGYTYIFMAFAEAPLVGSNNVPATAR